MQIIQFLVNTPIFPHIDLKKVVSGYSTRAAFVQGILAKNPLLNKILRHTRKIAQSRSKTNRIRAIFITPPALIRR